ncbi:Mitochondrial import receptor subunit tom7, partial [Pseudocercospora fuligena]
PNLSVGGWSRFGVGDLLLGGDQWTSDLVANTFDRDIIATARYKPLIREQQLIKMAWLALSEESKIGSGYLPLIIYLGYTRSNPRPSLIRLFSPLAQ